MLVAVPKEVLPGEDRVGLIPDQVKALKDWGWTVAVEAGAGVASGHSDDDYKEAGAEILPFCHIERAKVGADSRIGPYARLRPGTELAEDVHIGNFVEVKNSQIAAHSKANHLAYVGDALSVLALSIMFSLSLALHRADPAANRLRIWAVPAIAVLVSFPLGYVARTWPADAMEAIIVCAARALLASLFAIAHLSMVQRRR